MPRPLYYMILSRDIICITMPEDRLTEQKICIILFGWVALVSFVDHMIQLTCIRYLFNVTSSEGEIQTHGPEFTKEVCGQTLWPEFPKEVCRHCRQMSTCLDHSINKNRRRFVLNNCFIQSAIIEKMQIENPVLTCRYLVFRRILIRRVTHKIFHRMVHCNSCQKSNQKVTL